jgi:hypothetical protein
MDSYALAFQQKFDAPDFFLRVPKGHFTGVSSPMPSLAQARKAAISDVVRQILRSIDVKYEHYYVDRASGKVLGKGVKRIVDDRLSGFSKGIVLRVEQNIVNKQWHRDEFGKYVYFVLVRYPEKMIAEMRRLSRGAKIVVAALFDEGDNEIRLQVSEVNGVAVTITSADIKICKTNRFSKAISLFVWKVPSVIEHKSLISIDPVMVCGNSANIPLPTSVIRKSLTDYLLGADFDAVAI